MLFEADKPAPRYYQWGKGWVSGSPDTVGYVDLSHKESVGKFLRGENKQDSEPKNEE